MVDPRIKKISESRNRSHDSVMSVLSKSECNSNSTLSGLQVNQYKSFKKNLNFKDALRNIKVLRFASSSVGEPEPDYEAFGSFNPGAKGIEF